LFPATGEPVPDAEVRAPGGEAHRLAEFVAGPTLLIFLRHLH
jgi:hypothetical protein